MGQNAHRTQEVQRMHTLVILAANGDVAEVKTAFDVRTIAGLAATAVPVVVQVLSKKTASAGLKALLNVVGVSLVTALAFITDPGNTVITWQTVVNVFLTALVTSVTSYNVLKAFGISGTIAEKTKGIGFDSPPSVQTEDAGAEDELEPAPAVVPGADYPGGQADPEVTDPAQLHEVEDEK
jgi:hypothetical protein